MSIMVTRSSMDKYIAEVGQSVFISDSQMIGRR